MGFRVLLIAVSGKDTETVHREYGVEATSKYEEIAESPVTGAKLPNGAYLLYINDEIIPDDSVFKRLSENSSLIACYANETVMNSYTTLWKDGIERWSVFHDAEQGLNHLDVKGEVPDEFSRIRDDFVAKQEKENRCETTRWPFLAKFFGRVAKKSKDVGCDYLFEVPVELFVAGGGIRYCDDGPKPWQVLSRK